MNDHPIIHSIIHSISSCDKAFLMACIIRQLYHHAHTLTLDTHCMLEILIPKATAEGRCQPSTSAPPQDPCLCIFWRLRRQKKPKEKIDAWFVSVGACMTAWGRRQWSSLKNAFNVSCFMGGGGSGRTRLYRNWKASTRQTLSTAKHQRN